MRSSLYRLSTGRPQVVDPETEEDRDATDRELLNMGYKVVGTESGDEVVHAAPGVGPPDGADVLKDGGEAPWQWSGLPDEMSSVADAVLHAVWEEEDSDGKMVRRRGPQGPAESRGDIPTAVATHMPSHHWSGDS